MELTEYQVAAALTAQPAAYDRAYLIPGIVGEVGELFGQRAKSVWHGWPAARLEQELVSEYGDVAWMTAILLDLEGIRGIRDVLHGQARTIWGDDLDPWHIVHQKANTLHLYYTQPATNRYLKGEAEQLWLALERYCEHITGRSFDYVLRANLSKLADRAARGVLQGAGDHR